MKLKPGLAVLAIVAVSTATACARATRREAPVVAPPPADTAAVAVRKDAAALTDSVRRADSVRVADSLRIADSTRKALADTVKPVATDTGRTAKLPVRRPRAARDCILDLTNSPPESRFTDHSFPDGTHVTYVGGGFVGTCQGQNNTISADSAEYLQSAGVVNLYGNVRYREPQKVDFSAQRANYFLRDERLFAEGNVVATQIATGSTFRGNSMEYYRAKPGFRDKSRLYAPSRPNVTIIERDSSGRQPIPILISANVMEDQGDSVIFAWGQVHIDRGDIEARADSSSYDKFRSQARLIRSASVESKGNNQPFKLTGDTVQMFNRDRELERVVALHNATAINEDLTLKSENLDMRLVNRQLERAFAFGTGRSTAVTPQQELAADSLAIFLAGRRVREVHAVGAAVAVGTPDTLKIRSLDRDMLRGDTLVARFDTIQVPGDTSQARLREIESRGNATSLFQVANKQGPNFAPALNYARGKAIYITFDSGVRNVRVDSAASGVFLEALPDSLADSTRRRRPPAGQRVLPTAVMRVTPAGGSVPERPRMFAFVTASPPFRHD